MEQLRQLYIQWSGKEPAEVKLMAGAGSNRAYYRFFSEDGKTVVGVVGTSVDENKAFIYLSAHFRAQQQPVPEVLAVSEDGMRYLQTDLGGRSLFDALSEGRSGGGTYNEDEIVLLRRTIRSLPGIQIKGAEGLDFMQCYPQAEMDETTVFFDLNYFKYCFLKATYVDFHEMKLEEDFRRMAKDLTEGGLTGFLYRDFQARNVMLDNAGNPYFIDYQGGRRGPVEYDVASFLWQASAHYSPQLRERLIDDYLDALGQYVSVDAEQFRKRLNLFVLFRTMQVLGAYGFRGYFERKKHFLDSIVPAIGNLRQILQTGCHAYPYLREILVRLTELSQFQCKKSDNTSSVTVNRDTLKATESQYDGKGALVVRIFSFSYRKGIPQDDSGNGGGYVFDCRSTHNPGRYEPYKKLTGLDEPVIRFLEDDGEILTFLESVYKLADAHVARYIQRGFTNLMFSFGCTGGQHRSVYSAQHLAEHLHEKFGIEVRLCHREQHIEQILKAK